MKTSPWDIYYIRLVHLGDHATFLRFQWEDKGPEWDIPLYEAKLIGTFDHRFSTFDKVSQSECIAGQPRTMLGDEKRNPNIQTVPRYFLPRSFTRNLFAKYPNYERKWFLIWRH